MVRSKSKKNPGQLCFAFDAPEFDIMDILSKKMNLDVNIIYTDNLTTMMSAGIPENGRVSVRLHNMFRDADMEVIEAVAQYIKKRDRHSSTVLGRFIKENNHLIRTKTRKKKKVAIVTQGECHDLAAYCVKLNDRYFDGELDVIITWGDPPRRKRRRHIRLGSYSFEDRIIRIHPALDNKWVPGYYVESVIYHEMLHAHFGYQSKNGRTRYHTRQFNQREKQFEHFRRAMKWEKKHIQRLVHGRSV